MTTSAKSPDSKRQADSRLKPEALGALIDAIYAVAITMLALEIPSEVNAEFDATFLTEVLLEYCIAFLVLFAFWFQHRRIIAHTDYLSHSILWLNAAALLLVCLVPRATTLIFAYGGDVTLVDLELQVLGKVDRSRSALVDGLYVVVVIVADLLLLALSHSAHAHSQDGMTRHVRRVKAATSSLLVTCLLLSLALPISNRYFVMLLPLAFLLEARVSRKLAWHP